MAVALTPALPVMSNKHEQQGDEQLNEKESKGATFLVGVLTVVVAWTGGVVAGLFIMDSYTTPPAVCHSLDEDVTGEHDMLDCDYSNGSWYPTEDIDPVVRVNGGN